MYRNVYLQNGSVECYYTGHTIELPDKVDPSAFLNNDDDPIGINAEHIYPQSKGAGEGFARRDMHHLIPVIRQVNEARSNYPFAEIDDSDTDRWFYQTDIVDDIPLDDDSLYSEVLNGGFGNSGLFEPRESVKGDVARAVFYFYTMYREEADTEDPEYFHLMKDQLYEWHLNDPADSLEIIRNELKAVYQQGKVNPFILDCSLVGRAYFQDSLLDCSPSISTSTVKPTSSNILIYPNPTKDKIYISTSFNESYKVEILDPLGRRLTSLSTSNEIDVSNLEKGIYYFLITNSDNSSSIYKVNKVN